MKLSRFQKILLECAMEHGPEIDIRIVREHPDKKRLGFFNFSVGVIETGDDHQLVLALMDGDAEKVILEVTKNQTEPIKEGTL